MARTVSALTVMFALVAAIAIADEAGKGMALSNAWKRIERLNAESAAAMPEANYGFKPAPTVRSFGQIIGHLANDQYNLCSQAKGEANPKKSVDYEKTTAKADLIKALDESNAYCDGVYGSTKNNDQKTLTTLLLNVTHDSEHYGNLVTYLRMKGIVPPSSQPSK